MDSEIFFQKVNQYTNLTNEAKQEWAGLLKKKEYLKGAYFIAVGQIPKKVAFVVTGLFSQYFITDAGDTVIKYLNNFSFLNICKCFALATVPSLFY